MLGSVNFYYGTKLSKEAENYNYGRIAEDRLRREVNFEKIKSEKSQNYEAFSGNYYRYIQFNSIPSSAQKAEKVSTAYNMWQKWMGYQEDRGETTGIPQTVEAEISAAASLRPR